MAKRDKAARPESDHDRMTKSGRLRIEEVKKALESSDQPPASDRIKPRSDKPDKE